jgi:hypothetical protein
MNSSSGFLPPLSHFPPNRNPGRHDHLQSPPVKTFPGQAVATIVTAVLVLLIPQKESNRRALNHPRRAHLPWRRQLSIPASPTFPYLADTRVVLAVSY